MAHNWKLENFDVGQSVSREELNIHLHGYFYVFSSMGKHIEWML